MSPARDQDTLDLLADVARSFATPDPGRVRKLRDGGGGIDRVMWGALAENGWLSIPIAVELDGAGLGIEAVALVARRLGYAGFPEPFAAAGVLAPLLLAAGQGDLWRARLAAAMAGEQVVAVAWQGSEGDLDPAETVAVTAATDGDGVVLDGVSRFVRVAPAGTDEYLVAARTTGGVAVYWVPATVPGLSVSTQRCADGTADAALSLTGVRVASADCLVGPDRGVGALAEAVEFARVAVAAELVGLMDRVLELTLDFLRDRKQFGKPIGAFQVLQHRMVDAWMQRELAAAALAAAIAVFENAASTARQRMAAASSAKARAAQAAHHVCAEALQLHGAIGYSDEYDLGLYFNRALTLGPWLGGAGEHRRRYAGLMEVHR